MPKRQLTTTASPASERRNRPRAQPGPRHVPDFTPFPLFPEARNDAEFWDEMERWTPSNWQQAPSPPAPSPAFEDLCSECHAVIEHGYMTLNTLVHFAMCPDHMTHFCGGAIPPLVLPSDPHTAASGGYGLVDERTRADNHPEGAAPH